MVNCKLSIHEKLIQEFWPLNFWSWKKNISNDNAEGLQNRQKDILQKTKQMNKFGLSCTKLKVLVLKNKLAQLSLSQSHYLSGWVGGLVVNKTKIMQYHLQTDVGWKLKMSLAIFLAAFEFSRSLLILFYTILFPRKLLDSQCHPLLPSLSWYPMT